MAATQSQVDGTIRAMQELATTVLDLEASSKRITEAYDELLIGDYVQNPENIDPDTGFVLGTPMTPADIQAGAFLANMFVSFMRGQSPQNDQYYRIATKLQRLE